MATVMRRMAWHHYTIHEVHQQSDGWYAVEVSDGIHTVVPPDTVVPRVGDRLSLYPEPMPGRWCERMVIGEREVPLPWMRDGEYVPDWYKAWER